MASLRFSVMYTKHLTQKRKSWEDGYIIVKGKGFVLHDLYSKKVMAKHPLTASDLPLSEDDSFQTERFLVEVAAPEPLDTGAPDLSAGAVVVSSTPSSMTSLMIPSPT